jgi:hypothetical protein
MVPSDIAKNINGKGIKRILKYTRNISGGITDLKIYKIFKILLSKPLGEYSIQCLKIG